MQKLFCTDLLMCGHFTAENKPQLVCLHGSMVISFSTRYTIITIITQVMTKGQSSQEDGRVASEMPEWEPAWAL